MDLPRQVSETTSAAISPRQRDFSIIDASAEQTKCPDGKKNPRVKQGYCRI
jgi:hypothetical protein